MLIFAYGTLKHGHCRNHLLVSQKFISEAKTKEGYTIFNCGGFPGLVHDTEDEDSYVQGEIWDINESYIDYLDQVEGSPYLYRLEQINVEGYDNVYSYFWQKSTKGLKECGPVWRKEYGEGEN